MSATETPSKQTATGLKGRLKDKEAAEDTRQKRIPAARRRPSFRGVEESASAYGNIVHKVMQYVRFDCCGSAEGIRDELDRLVSLGILGQEEASRVRQDQVLDFFKSEIGARLVSGAECIREYKFSILDHASKYAEDLDGEKLLLQGVVDCAIMDPEGITVIDFKTDHVTSDTVAEASERYRPQVMAYSDALGRIFEKEVIRRYLYFFSIGEYISI